MKDLVLQNIDSYINARTAQHKADLSALLDLRAQVASIQEAAPPPPPPPPPPVVVTPKGIDAKARGVIPDGRDNTVALQKLVDEAASQGQDLYLSTGDWAVNGNNGGTTSIAKGTLRVPNGKRIKFIGDGIGKTKLRTAQEKTEYGLTLILAEPNVKVGIENLSLIGPKDPNGGVWYPNQNIQGAQGDGSRTTSGIEVQGGKGCITVRNCEVGQFALGVNARWGQMDIFITGSDFHHSDMSVQSMDIGGNIHVFDSKFHDISEPPPSVNGYRGHPFYLPNAAKGIWIENCEGWNNGGYFAQIIAVDGHEAAQSDYVMFRKCRIGQQGKYHLSGIVTHPRSLTVIDDCDITTQMVGAWIINSVAVINSRFKGFTKDRENIPLKEYSQANTPRFVYSKNSVYECIENAIKVTSKPAELFLGGNTFTTGEESVLLSGSGSRANLYKGNVWTPNRTRVNGATSSFAFESEIPDLSTLAPVPASAPKIQTVD